MAAADGMSVSSGPAATKVQRRLPLGPIRLPGTPGRLRLAALTLTVGLAALGVVGVRAALQRDDATRAVELEATPLLVGAEELYVALADADAAASTAFLHAGVEPTGLRSRYLTDLATAGHELAGVAHRPGLSEQGRRRVAMIAETLPAYAAKVEAARTNNRFEAPVGAEYLRQASNDMRATMLPAATAVYDEAARQLYSAYAAGTQRSASTRILLVGGVVAGLLLLTQVFLAVRTRRLINLGLLGATILVVALGGWAVLTLEIQQEALVRSQRDGSDQLLVLSIARIDALRSLSDENLHLIARGTERTHREDFDRLAASIGDDPGGLLASAAALAERTGTTRAIAEVRRLYDDYLAVDARVRQLDDAHAYNEAVDLAINDEAEAAGRLDRGLAAEIAAARARLDSYAADARGSLRWLAVAVAVTVVLAAGLVLYGLQQRIREYR